MRQLSNFRALFIISLFFVSCATKQDEKTPVSPQIHEQYIKTIQTDIAKLMPTQKEVTLTGKVEYDPDKYMSYTPLISGVVEKTNFSLGDKVTKGQNLLTIRSADLSGMYTEVMSAESQVKIAKREYKTAKTLFEDNLLSEKELYENESEMNRAIVLHQKLKNDLSLYIANSDGTFSIKAPVSGYIVEKNIAPGTPITPEIGNLFTIADLSHVWIVVNIYAGDLQLVKEGMDVKISTLSYPDEIFDAKIGRISQVFDPEEKVLKARIFMQNKQLKFKPEMSVVVHLRSQKGISLIGIPSNALIFDNDQYSVVVRKDSVDFEIKKVTLAGHHNKTTFLSSGLDENEVVITKNQLLIYNELNEK